MSEESVVTFVGGKAVEQSEGLDSNLGEDEREAAKAAVRKAIQEAGDESAEDTKSGKTRAPGNRDTPVLKDEKASSDKPEKEAAPERGPDGKFLPRDGKPAAKGDSKREPDGSDDNGDELDLDKASVKQLLKQRERVAAIKRDAKDEISKAQRDFQAQQQSFQAQQQAFAQERAALERERKSWQAIKSDPARAIREGGYDPEQFILDLAQEGTPEGQRKRQDREIQEQLAEIKAWRQEQAQAVQRQQHQYQQAQQAQARQNAVQSFVKLGLDEEKYPHVATFYQGQERALVAFGDLAAEEYRHLSNGKEGSFEDILDYIEDQLAERANNWYTKKGKGSQKTDTQNSQEKPKSKGKTLSPESSGERRSHTKSALQDLDGDERLEAAKQAVARAMAQSRSEQD